jgi:universal stress protein A
MKQIRTILVPHDFSPAAGAALREAGLLAQSLDAKLVLLHVFRQPIEVLSPYEIALPESLVQEVRDASTKRLEAELAKLPKGVPAEAQVREGPPEEVIPAAAADLHADLIVMGTRGLTGLKHVLLGSVAERTLRAAPCPVLCVRDPS